MTTKILFCAIFILLCNTAISSTDPKNDIFKRISYYTRWQLESKYLTPDKVNVTLFTHLIFAFAIIQNDSMVPGDPIQDPQRFQDLLKLKIQSPSLKVMISAVGADSKTMSDIVSSSDRREKFVNSTILFLRKYGFDGLDIDWEFPAWNGSPLSDKDNFVLLLNELRNAFDKEPNPFILSIAVSAAWTIIIPAYNIPKINRYVDFINLMTYDFHTYIWYDPVTGHNSPLFPRKNEIFVWATLNTAWAAHFWVNQGMNKSKVLVGLPTYGNSYILKDPEQHGFGAPAIQSNGTHQYYQNFQFAASGATRVFDDESKVPYAYKNQTWIGYDDVESFTAKCNFVKEEEFGGVFTWSLEQDDWNNICKQGTFPLHTVIYNILS